MKSWLHANGIEIYSIYNRRKSAVAERFIRTLKSKICKVMIAISKNVYIDKLDEIVDKYRFFCISNLIAKPDCLNLGKTLSNLLRNREALN